MQIKTKLRNYVVRTRRQMIREKYQHESGMPVLPKVASQQFTSRLDADYGLVRKSLY
jgi:hypothetical protein